MCGIPRLGRAAVRHIFTWLEVVSILCRCGRLVGGNVSEVRLEKNLMCEFADL
jgi:hypothetical protein